MSYKLSASEQLTDKAFWKVVRLNTTIEELAWLYGVSTEPASAIVASALQALREYRNESSFALSHLAHARTTARRSSGRTKKKSTSSATRARTKGCAKKKKKTTARARSV